MATAGSVAEIRGGFVKSGFAKLGNADLDKALSQPTSDKGRKVIALADTRLPPAVDAPKLRSFLDGGGVLVLLGPDPLIYGFGPTGEPQTINEEKAKVASASTRPTRNETMAITCHLHSSGVIPGADGAAGEWPRRNAGMGQARPGLDVLATDWSGMGTAWMKCFANGALLIDLLSRTGSWISRRTSTAIHLVVVCHGGQRAPGRRRFLRAALLA